MVPTRKQPHGVCPAPGSKTGFGQSAGDFKPFLRHKGHRNKMPIRRRGSAASRKMGLRVPVHNTSKPQRPAAQISFSEQEQTSGAMLSGGAYWPWKPGWCKAEKEAEKGVLQSHVSPSEQAPCSAARPCPSGGSPISPGGRDACATCRAVHHLHGAAGSVPRPIKPRRKHCLEADKQRTLPRQVGKQSTVPPTIHSHTHRLNEMV